MKRQSLLVSAQAGCIVALNLLAMAQSVSTKHEETM